MKGGPGEVCSQGAGVGKPAAAAVAAAEAAHVAAAARGLWIVQHLLRQLHLHKQR